MPVDRSAADWGDVLLWRGRFVPSMKPGVASSGTATVWVPSTVAPGTYFLLACADTAKELAEANPNCLA